MASNLNRIFHALKSYYNGPRGRKMTRREFKRNARVTARAYPHFHSFPLINPLAPSPGSIRATKRLDDFILQDGL